MTRFEDDDKPITFQFCADCCNDITEEVANTGTHVCVDKQERDPKEVVKELEKTFSNKVNLDNAKFELKRVNYGI
jgi:Cu/Ag efflux pump CusA